MHFSLPDAFNDHETNTFHIIILRKQFNTLVKNYLETYRTSFDCLMHFLEVADLNANQTESILSLKSLLIRKPLDLILETIGAPQAIDYPYGGPYQWIYRNLVFNKAHSCYEPIYLVIAGGTCVNIGYFSQEDYNGYN
jgi:hypothetical protein